MFENFQRLPLELRREIWLLALPGSRTVTVYFSNETGHFHATTAQPILLYVCQESRRAITKTYTAYFAVLGHAPTIWLNLAIDRVQISWDMFPLRVIGQGEIDNIRHLDITIKPRYFPFCTASWIVGEIGKFSNLDTLTIVWIIYPEASLISPARLAFRSWPRVSSLQAKADSFKAALSLRQTLNPGWKKPELILIWKYAGRC